MAKSELIERQTCRFEPTAMLSSASVPQRHSRTGMYTATVSGRLFPSLDSCGRRFVQSTGKFCFNGPLSKCFCCYVSCNFFLNNLQQHISVWSRLRFRCGSTKCMSTAFTTCFIAVKKSFVLWNVIHFVLLLIKIWPLIDSWRDATLKKNAWQITFQVSSSVCLTAPVVPPVRWRIVVF